MSFKVESKNLFSQNQSAFGVGGFAANSEQGSSIFGSELQAFSGPKEIKVLERKTSAVSNGNPFSQGSIFGALQKMNAN